MFRGKESSNRIELSRLVQDLLNFGVLGSLQLWEWGCGWMGVGGWLGGWLMWVGVVGGVGGWGWGWLGGAPHTCVHACARTCDKHDNFMQMAAPIGGILGNSL